MYLHLGGEVTVLSKEVIGVFDIERCSVSKTTADYLAACQKSGKIITVSEDMPKSFIVTDNATFISNVSNNTINLRGKKGE